MRDVGSKRRGRVETVELPSNFIKLLFRSMALYGKKKVENVLQVLVATQFEIPSSP